MKHIQAVIKNSSNWGLLTVDCRYNSNTYYSILAPLEIAQEMAQDLNCDDMIWHQMDRFLTEEHGQWLSWCSGSSISDSIQNLENKLAEKVLKNKDYIFDVGDQFQAMWTIKKQLKMTLLGMIKLITIKYSEPFSKKGKIYEKENDYPRKHS